MSDIPFIHDPQSRFLAECLAFGEYQQDVDASAWRQNNHFISDPDCPDSIALTDEIRDEARDLIAPIMPQTAPELSLLHRKYQRWHDLYETQ